VYSSENGITLGCESRIEYSGVWLRRLWPAWNHVLVIVKPETVIACQRAGFRLFWRLRSKPKTPGRPKLDAEVRALIRRMVKENSTWGAPRIHGELLKLGFDVCERTVSRYIRRLSPPEQARKLWATLLRNHREVITAMDFFTGPTLNVTNTQRAWIVQQLREAFPESCPYRYAILDGDVKFGQEVTDVLRAGHKTRAHKPCKPVAEWTRGTLDRKLSQRASRSLDHSQ
jgi:hypothetical protein